MFATRLVLDHFRSYENADLALESGVSVFLGSNGRGKTNLIEALGYAATLQSHRVASDVPLVRVGSDRAAVAVRVQASPGDQRSLTVEVEINVSGANRVRLNKTPVRPRDVVGAIRVVTFAPEDLAIVTGDPAERRRFVDDVLVTRWPRYAGARADYERALKQRTALLKTLSGKHGRSASPDSAATLDVWDERIARFGGEIVAGRLAVLADLVPALAGHYAAIAPTANSADVRYRSSACPDWERGDGPREPDAIADLLRETLAARRADELVHGVTLAGPHRDDLVCDIAGLPAKGYASHGEAWSLALALRLASLDLLLADDVRPILLLDDVFAELDEVRRARVAAVADKVDQVLVTAAVEHDVPQEWRVHVYDVDTGVVTARGSHA